MAAGLTEEQGKVSQNDFHSELMKLRQRWRLKKSGNLILGDLSYKSGEYFIDDACIASVCRAGVKNIWHH